MNNKLIPWSEVGLSDDEWRGILRRAADSTGDVPYDWWVVRDKHGKIKDYCDADI